MLGFVAPNALGRRQVDQARLHPLPECPLPAPLHPMHSGNIRVPGQRSCDLRPVFRWPPVALRPLSSDLWTRPHSPGALDAPGKLARAHETTSPVLSSAPRGLAHLLRPLPGAPPFRSSPPLSAARRPPIGSDTSVPPS